MPHPVLRKGSGITDTSAETIAAVKELQSLLSISPADGKFGPGTEKVVQDFQRNNGLTPDGVVGPASWKVILTVRTPDEHNLDGFFGDLAWIHAREGHAGHAYWPGGASGVTLDPGFDLGHALPELFEEAYADILTPEEMKACRKVLGIKGEAAKKALDTAEIALKTLKISREEADHVFPYVATPYWKGITARFPSLLGEKVIGSVQTALLSLAFNRGFANRGLSVLENPMKSEDWARVAAEIGAMQQDHPLEGIRKRRKMESELILAEIGGKKR